jgi:hypothetical protein
MARIRELKTQERRGSGADTLKISPSHIDLADHAIAGELRGNWTRHLMSGTIKPLSGRFHRKFPNHPHSIELSCIDISWTT